MASMRCRGMPRPKIVYLNVKKKNVQSRRDTSWEDIFSPGRGVRWTRLLEAGGVGGVVDEVEEVGQAQTAFEELLLDDGRGLGNLVI